MVQIFRGIIVRYYLSAFTLRASFVGEKTKEFKLKNTLKPRKNLVQAIQLRLQSENTMNHRFETQQVVLKNILIAFNYDFSQLTELTLCYVNASVLVQIKFIKLLHMAPLLKELRLEEFRYSENLFVRILDLLKIYKNQIDVVLFQLYSKDLARMNTTKVLYILSLVAPLCFNKFHGQLDDENLKLGQKYFYVAADKINRQNRNTKIYLGTAQRKNKTDLNFFMKTVNLSLYMNSW